MCIRDRVCTETMASQFARPLQKKLKKPSKKSAKCSKITIEANKKVVNFLDVTFNLTNGCYKPFTEPNKLSYVHQQSNHPPALLNNIPLNINKRLTSISSSKEVFDESIPPYQKALTESGYDHKLTYNLQQEKALKNKRKRTRNITWYDPPFN